MRLSRPHKLFAKERETVEEAFPGDILGLVNPGAFAIGDCVSSKGKIKFQSIPRFAPEFFASIRCPDPSNRKRFLSGLDQLLQEGALQVFYPADITFAREPIVAVAGRLQFDVVQFRLKSEYSVDTIMEHLDGKHIRWIGGSADDIAKLSLPIGCKLLDDSDGLKAILFDGNWALQRAQQNNTKIEFLEVAPEAKN